MLSFEIWNHVSGNAVDGFATMQEALAGVREEVLANGWDYADDWTLVATDGETIEPIVAGQQVMILAFLAAPKHGAAIAERNPAVHRSGAAVMVAGRAEELIRAKSKRPARST